MLSPLWRARSTPVRTGRGSPWPRSVLVSPVNSISASVTFGSRPAAPAGGGGQVRPRHGDRLATVQTGLDLDHLAVAQAEHDVPGLPAPVRPEHVDLPLALPAGDRLDRQDEGVRGARGHHLQGRARPVDERDVGRRRTDQARSGRVRRGRFLLHGLREDDRRGALGRIRRRVGGRRGRDRARRQRGDRAQHGARERPGATDDLRLHRRRQRAGDPVGVGRIDGRGDPVPDEPGRHDRHAGGDGRAVVQQPPRERGAGRHLDRRRLRADVDVGHPGRLGRRRRRRAHIEVAHLARDRRDDAEHRVQPDRAGQAERVAQVLPDRLDRRHGRPARGQVGCRLGRRTGAAGQGQHRCRREHGHDPHRKPPLCTRTWSA